MDLRETQKMKQIEAKNMTIHGKTWQKANTVVLTGFIIGKLWIFYNSFGEIVQKICGTS